MMDEELKKEIEILKTEMSELNSKFSSLSNSISFPREIDDTLKQRGFINQDFFVIGYGEIGVAGQFTQEIPNAGAKSIVLANWVSVSVTNLPILALVRQNPTTGKYEIYVEGTATEQFAYIVFLNKENLYTEL